MFWWLIFHFFEFFRIFECFLKLLKSFFDVSVCEKAYTVVSFYSLIDEFFTVLMDYLAVDYEVLGVFLLFLGFFGAFKGFFEGFLNGFWRFLGVRKLTQWWHLFHLFIIISQFSYNPWLCIMDCTVCYLIKCTVC